MTTMLKKKDWSTQTRRALTATEVVANLAKLEGWSLSGDGANVAIEKTYRFANYYETISFVNALAFVANAQDHHPDLSVHYNRCVVRFNTHDVGGISPGPGGNFIRGRKAVTVGAEATYIDRWAFDLAYTNYFGAGDLNLIRDRDFIQFTAKYSF